MSTITTRAGCRITVERVGPSIGVTIHPAGDKPRLYACSADEAAAVCVLIAPEAVREARAEALEDAANALDQAAIAEESAAAPWLRERAAKERGR